MYTAIHNHSHSPCHHIWPLSTLSPHQIHSTSPSSVRIRGDDTITARETALAIARVGSSPGRIRLIPRLGRLPENRRTALTLDARDFNRVALRREREQQAPARGARAPESGAVDVDDEVAVALPS